MPVGGTVFCLVFAEPRLGTVGYAKQKNPTTDREVDMMTKWLFAAIVILLAQELCSKLRSNLKSHHVQTGAGHYGVFAGRRWATQIYPLLRKQNHDGSEQPFRHHVDLPISRRILLLGVPDRS